jgi:hypothetical protein
VYAYSWTWHLDQFTEVRQNDWPSARQRCLTTDESFTSLSFIYLFFIYLILFLYYFCIIFVLFLYYFYIIFVLFLYFFCIIFVLFFCIIFYFYTYS